jgi:alpha-methylacyl-CoA racemase
MSEPWSPLAGLVVVDLSQNLPGPLLTQLLRGLGAWVVKVEPPQGEGLRWMPPHHGGTNVGFAAINAGKASVAVDLKRPEGQQVLRAMVARADVLVESFRPGVLTRLGLDPAALCALHPRLIVCSVTGFGQGGPDAERPGHDLNFLARSGLLGLFGPPGGPPVVPAVQVADVGGGSLPGVIAVLAAVLERQRTGRGRHLDVSLAAGALTFGAMALPAAHEPEEGGGTGFLTGGLPCYRCYRTADGGFLAVGALEPKFWAAFCAAAGQPELARRGFDRSAEAHAAVEALVGSRTRAAWVEALRGVDCCVEPVLSPAEAVADPGAQPCLQEVDGLTVVVPRLGAASAPPRTLASALGADLDEVADRLGLDPDLLWAATAAGAVGQP